ncbi:hypothetical protein LX64_01678 [Chitinophaga skermanii]|uniref:Uncharacterized protein n=1 Tax=Chitinophaga skermanii TaxID=331697 RepID=A0A327QQM3_9BACT|nr:hypothetical protein LX64_01678 [Chitinophaga skermanii]
MKVKSRRVEKTAPLYWVERDRLVLNRTYRLEFSDLHLSYFAVDIETE